MASAYTQADLTTLTRAIALGAKRVQYEDREVTYRSLEEMTTLQRQMQQCLGQGPAAPVRKVTAHSRGFGPSRSFDPRWYWR